MKDYEIKNEQPLQTYVNSLNHDMSLRLVAGTSGKTNKPIKFWVDDVDNTIYNISVKAETEFINGNVAGLQYYECRKLGSDKWFKCIQLAPTIVTIKRTV